MAGSAEECGPNNGQRPGETVLSLPDGPDATVFFLGRLRTPWTTRAQCPKRGDTNGPDCRIELDPRWEPALDGIERYDRLQVLYWMHLARRDLATQRPRSAAGASGTFALRSPMRPNPIASSVVHLIGRSGPVLVVRGLDCIDGTPLVDLKPERCPLWSADLGSAGQITPGSV